MAVVGSIGDVKNVPIQYVQAKTKADKFVEKLNLSASSEKVITNISFADRKINTSDSFNKYPEKELFSKLEKSFEKPYSASHMGVKTTVKDKLEVLERGLLEKDSGFGFVEIEEETIETQNIISDNIPRAQDLKRMSFINKINNQLDSFNFKSNVRENIFVKIMGQLSTLTLKEDPKDVIVDALDIALSENVASLIKAAELAEDMLDLTVTFDINIEIDFLAKLRQIIVDLEASIREMQKEVESKKKDSKVEIKIKRFDLKEIQTKRKIT